MDITNLVRRFNKQEPIVAEEDAVTGDIEGFDVAERISYIGMLRREIDALDFSLPILKSLFSDKTKKELKPTLETSVTSSEINNLVKENYSFATSSRGYGNWPDESVKPYLTKTIQEKSKILVKNILKAQSQNKLPPHDTAIDSLVDVVGCTIDSISNFAAVQPLENAIGLIYNMKRDFNKDDEHISSFQITSTAVETSSRKLDNASPHHSIWERFVIGLSNVEDNLIDTIRKNISTTTLTSDVNLLQELQKLSNEIAKRTRRGRANKLMVSSKFGTVLDYILSLSVTNHQTQSDTHKIIKDVIVSKYSKYIGMLFGNIKVYASPYLIENEMFLYYQGDSDADAGFTYCPYVIYNESGSIIHPHTFEPVIMALTRSGLHSDNISNYYTRILYN